MKNRVYAFAIPAVILLAAFLVPSLLTNQSSVTNKPSKEDVLHKMQRIQIPFIANDGQVDEQVDFYAKTFGGTVFVTKEGEIVYALPANSSELRVQGSECGGELHSPSRTHPRPLLLEGSSGCLTDASLRERDRVRGISLKEELVGAKVKAIQGEQPSVTKVNYFKGNDPSQWKTNIFTYNEVNLGEVYEGIELRLRAYGNNVEKLFCIKPGADPEQIKIRLSGLKDCGVQNAEITHPLVPSREGINPKSAIQNLSTVPVGGQKLQINEHGELVAETELGPVSFTKPVAYQEINGKRVEVECKYMIVDCGMQNAEITHPLVSSREGMNPKSAFQNLSPAPIWDQKFEYGFKVASYDRTKPLIIDPLLASTYLGGSDFDYVNSLALDTSGNVYVTGYTYSSDFPTTSGAYDTSFNGGYYTSYDVFVSKLDGGLTSLLASTYLGGSSYADAGTSLALDTSGNVYVTGYTESTDFPTTSGAYNTSQNGIYSNVFISKLDSGLSSLLASTYLGGSRTNFGMSLALDTSGDVYVTGYTDSPDFPTTSGAYDTSQNGYRDVFISKLDGGLSSLLASTYLGGTSDDYGESLALDTGGDVYVTGRIYSTDFPTTSGAYDTSQNGSYDVFVSKLDGGLTSLLASTYLGGTNADYVRSLALDTIGGVYVTGHTESTDFPTTIGAYDTSQNTGVSDVFISKLNGGLTSLLASTYLGGSNFNEGYSLALDTSGNVYVTGVTSSTNFPTTSGAYDTSVNYFGDVFISKLDGGLTSLLASTYLGGTSGDHGKSLALDTSGNVYVTGFTYSSDFPTTSGAYDSSFSGNNDTDVFISKLDSDLSASISSTPTPTPTATPTASPTPTITATPTPCDTATAISAPASVTVAKGDSTEVTVTVIGADGCAVVGDKVKATSNDTSITTVSPSRVRTDANGQATFTITGEHKGSAKVKFRESTANLKTKTKVTVTR